MKTVRPRRLDNEGVNVPLSEEEGFLLARIDGHLTLPDLVALTGIQEERVEQIVSKLAERGSIALEAVESSGRLPDVDSSPSLVDANDGDSTTSLADFASVLGLDPSAYASLDGNRKAAVEQPVERTRIDARSSFPPPEEPPLDPTLSASDALLDADEGSRSDEEREADAAEHDALKIEHSHDYRRYYEEHFHPLPADARANLAKTARGIDLLALCLDGDPRVVVAVLDNTTTGFAEARLIALHHRTGTGLELLSRRNEFVRDALTERRLLKNPQCGDIVLQRVMASKRLFQTYKIAIDRDVPDLTRSKARGFLRRKYQSAPSEERAELVLQTEGRCLVLMTGCAFDGKMTGILCSRPYNSVLFIQNLAKFSATPPLLLSHLMRQPFVKHHVPLKKLLLQHPNMPGDMKSRG